MNLEDSAKLICSTIESKKIWTIGRNGATELQALLDYKNGIEHGSGMLDLLETSVGVFPANKESVDKWANEYLEGLSSFDIMVSGWFQALGNQENELISTLSSAEKIPLRALETYYVDKHNRWTSQLANKHVVVISSFTKSMQSQLLRKEEIWGELHESILPSSTEWSFVQTGYAPLLANGRCEWPLHVKNWEDSVEYIVSNVEKSGAEIALIGCGGLGMIVAMRLHKLGISSIVLGGAIQVYFGIKGSRWQNHDIIGKFWNDAWVWPLNEETPNQCKLVESGCYWGKPINENIISSVHNKISINNKLLKFIKK